MKHEEIKLGEKVRKGRDNNVAEAEAKLETRFRLHMPNLMQVA